MKSESSRFIALDVFRGLAIALMILVNTPGDWGHVYAPLLHSQWHGFTPTDTVFPFFLFIVGASIFFAFSARGFVLDRRSFEKVVKRALIMFLIGLSLNAYNAALLGADHVRVMGVLQRISLCYLVGAFIVLSCRIRMIYIISILILVLYYLVFIIFGGDAPFELQSNIVAKVDALIIGEAAMWKMQGVAFDPEGLLSTMPAIVTLLFGFETARRLSTLSGSLRVLRWLTLNGAGLIVIAYAVSFIMPINKNLWSISFVLLTAGLALLTLAVCVYLTSNRHLQGLSRLLQIYGTNPLFVYCLSWLTATAFMAIPVGGTSLYTTLWASLLPIMSPKLASLVFAFTHVAFFWLVSLILYRRDIIVKI